VHAFLEACRSATDNRPSSIMNFTSRLAAERNAVLWLSEQKRLGLYTDDADVDNPKECTTGRPTTPAARMAELNSCASTGHDGRAHAYQSDAVASLELSADAEAV